MKSALFIIAVISLILGISGYLEKIFGWQYNAKVRWVMLGIFVLSWGGMRVLEVIKEKRAAESFYGKERIEVFSHSQDAAQRMQFYTDEQSNKCVVLTLEKTAVPKSVKLFEGGYEAPPITLGFNGNKVLFKNSAYASFEEYLKQGPVYQVRYFPKE